MKQRPSRRYPTTEIAAFIENETIKDFLERSYEDQMEPLGRAYNLMGQLLESKCIMRDGTMWNDDPVWRLMDGSPVNQEEIENAIRLLHQNNYLVVKRNLSNSQNVMKVLTSEPQDIYTVASKIYGENYTPRQARNIGYILRRLREQGLAEMPKKSFIDGRWVGCWRAVV